jgi:hypothetical protein
MFSKALPSTSSSLLLGIIFRIKEQMPKDLPTREENIKILIQD